MQENLIGFLLAIFSMIGLGVSNFLYKRGTETLGPVNTTFFYYLFGLCIVTVVWVLFREKDKVLFEGIRWPMLIAIALSASVLAFNHAVKYINVSIGSIVRSLSFVVTVALAVLFLKEKLYLKDYIALACAIVAITLFGIE